MVSNHDIQRVPKKRVCILRKEKPFFFSDLRMHRMLVLLIPVSCAHCLVYFCGERVNCSISIAEEAGLAAV